MTACKNQNFKPYICKKISIFHGSEYFFLFFFVSQNFVSRVMVLQIASNSSFNEKKRNAYVRKFSISKSNSKLNFHRLQRKIQKQITPTNVTAGEKKCKHCDPCKMNFQDH